MGSSPFARTLLRGRGVFPGLFFCAHGRSSGQSLRASRFRTPLSLRDISRGRTETSVAVSVARTFFRDRGVFPGLFFYACGRSSGQSLRASRSRTPLSLRDISRGRTETSVAVSVARTFFRDRGVFPGLFFFACWSCLEKRPWPCEWDVGREPDRDERSEPPTAAPPPGAIQTLK